jgi:ABC-2 type transport system permease protein
MDFGRTTDRAVPVAHARTGTDEVRQPRPVPRRTSWKAPLLDGVLGVACYLLAYRLRFPGPVISGFLPGALQSLPIILLSQIAALIASGAYTQTQVRASFAPVLRGVTLGTVVGTGLTVLLLGYEGISRIAFLVDAVLLIICALGWRAAWRIWLAQAPPVAVSLPDGELVERTTGMASFGETFTALFRYRELLKHLVLKDLKLKYRGSVFGFIWSLVNPLVMILVYSLVFTYILKVYSQGFVLHLLLGVLAWTFFANSAMMSTGAIVDSAGLLKSVAFPRAILPIATVLFNLAQYLLTIAVFLPVMLALAGVQPAAPMLLFPVFLILQVLFTVGVALLLATATAFFRDVRHLLEVGLMVLIWTTPILYPFKQVPVKAQIPILLSPMSSFVLAYQQMFYYRGWPDFSVWLVAATYAFGAFVVGTAVFLAFEQQFGEQV